MHIPLREILSLQRTFSCYKKSLEANHQTMEKKAYLQGLTSLYLFLFLFLGCLATLHGKSLASCLMS